mmetsp:Transcript_20032/g.40836  ORF Transcript_20032/g.40836 Transcript_20032/m.40836 type:complete len:175 (-) Transcript_20032:54-578(-)
MARGEARLPWLSMAACFSLGWVAHKALACHTALSPPPPPPSLEERGPPTKQELGQAGWTLLHTLVANFPDEPSHKQSVRIETFLRGLGDFYPCPVCAAHFRSYMSEHPVASGSRKALSLWLCGAHNDVNKRNGREEFYCDIDVLDARWKDCGCGHNTSSTPVHPRGGLRGRLTV